MHKFVELVELDSGEVVAVGAFHTQEAAQSFSDHIEDYDNGDIPGVTGSRGGVRLLTRDALARELGLKPAQLKPKVG